MANVNCISKNNTDYMYEDTAGRNLIGSEQDTSTTAIKAYAVGDLFWLNNLLYRVTSAIASGGTITVGTNCVATTVSAELAARVKSADIQNTYGSTDTRPISGTGVADALSGFSTTLGGLNDVTLSSPTNNQVLKYNGSKWVNGTDSGHNMLPAPSSSVNEAAVVSAINTAISVDGGANDDVPSLYGVGVWSNEKNITIEVHGDTTTIDATGIGDWKEDSELVNPTAQDESGWGWVYIPELIGMGSNHTVDFKLTFDPVACGGPVTLGGYILDDTTGYLCIKFGNEIASPSTAIIGIEVIHKRNGRRVVGS